jgi:hypothetical protein
MPRLLGMPDGGNVAVRPPDRAGRDERAQRQEHGDGRGQEPRVDQV